MASLRSPNHFSLWLALAAACWGFGTVLTKHALGAIPPFTLAVVQLAASSFCLWLVVLGQRIPLHFNWHTGRLALTGLLEPGFTITLAVLGLQLTTATMTTLIFAAQPALVVVLAWLLLGERLWRPMLGLGVVAALGVGLVVGVDVQAGSGSLTGNLLVIASLISCSLYLVGSRRWVMNLHPVLLLALQQSVGLLWTLLVWPIELRQIGFAGLGALAPSVWLWAALSGVVYYALGFWLYIAGLKCAPASQAALFLSLTPLFGVAGASVLLGERLLPVQWLGAVLVIGAIGLTARTQPVEQIEPSLIPTPHSTP
jgi:drug/metabolite transporter (DMT)-like permease